MADRQWVNLKASTEGAKLLAERLGKSVLLCKLLISRGIKSIREVEAFLNPMLENMHDPFLLKEMDVAADRILKALELKEKIIIYGDYDVDGITGTSVLYDFLAGRGAVIDYYIPDRLCEGYGLSIESLEKIAGGKPGLIITVDCGITAVEEVEYINRQGIDIVITDHHECGEILPDACAVVNPHRHDCEYPFKELAGVGVVYKLIQALCAKIGLGNFHKKYLDLTALGTIADVVPLTGENRIIAKHGIERIAVSDNIGLKVLIECSGLSGKPVSSENIGFILAPRINAAGRLGDAGRGVELFITKNSDKARAIAAELDEENYRRQKTQSVIYEKVEEIIKSETDLEKEIVIVASGRDWHPGVIGIVASKVTEKYHRPCILICDEEGIGRGSGRSIEGFNIFEALKHCEEVLIRYGGHELAAGLSIEMDNLDAFKRMINSYAKNNLDNVFLTPRLGIDAVLSSDDISIESVRELDMLAPFGVGNPRPVFAYRGLRLKEIRKVGQDRHLKITVQDGLFLADGIGFNMGEEACCYSPGDSLDAAFCLEINTWNSVQKVQMNLKDIKPGGNLNEFKEFLLDLDRYIESEGLNGYNSNNRLLERLNAACESSLENIIKKIVPERDELGAVYKKIKSMLSEGTLRIADINAFAKQISISCGTGINFFKVKRGIEIFEELGVLKKTKTKGQGLLIELPDLRKAKLEDSSVYRNLQALKSRAFSEK
jgi:single-stranded-DNA-specific exonuclease